MDQDQDEWEEFPQTADPDEREAASLERSARLLEPPTEAELAEQEARAKANKVARIMAREPAAPPAPPEAVVRKVNADALMKPPEPAPKPPDNAVQAWMAESKAKRGEAETARRAKWAAIGGEISDEHKASPRRAVELLAMHLGAVDIATARERDELRREVRVLRSDLDFARKSHEAVSRQTDQLVKDVAALRREFDLQHKLESQRDKRRAETLEIALLAAGRNPVAREEADGDLPDFKDWRNAQ